MSSFRISKLIPSQSGLTGSKIIDISLDASYQIAFPAVDWNGTLYLSGWNGFLTKPLPFWIVENGLHKVFDLPFWGTMTWGATLPDGRWIMPCGDNISGAFSALMSYKKGDGIDTLCGSLTETTRDFTSGTGLTSRFTNINFAKADESGNIFIGHTGDTKADIIKVSPNGDTNLVYEIDHPGSNQYVPYSVAVDPSGRIFTCLTFNDYTVGSPTYLSAVTNLYRVKGGQLDLVAPIEDDARIGYADNMSMTESGDIIAVCTSLSQSFTDARMRIWKISPSGERNVLYSTGWVAQSGFNYYADVDRFGNIYFVRPI